MKNTSSAKVSRVVLALGVLFATGVASLSCGSSDPLTKGSFCSKIGAATCDRGLACGLITSADRAECGTVFQNACCGSNSTCGEKPADATEEMQINQIISACTTAFKTFNCDTLAAGEAPAECTEPVAQRQSVAPSGTDAVAKAGASAGRSFRSKP